MCQWTTTHPASRFSSTQVARTGRSNGVSPILAWNCHNDVAQGVYSGLEDPAVAASLRWIRLRMLLARSALYRTIQALLSPLAPVERAGGHAMATRTSPLYDARDRKRLAAVLQDNLRRLIQGVAPRPVILLVPVSNPHWTPTGTLVPASPAEAERLAGELEEVRQALSQGSAGEAARRLQEILGQHPQSAYAWWLQAQAMSRLGRPVEAARAEAMARDLDALPMRATTEIEKAVGAMKGCTVLDLPALLPRDNGLLRADLFFDILHLSDSGNALVAKIVAPAVSKACGAAGARSGAP